MVITNKFGLPEPIANFARADKYTKGASDISVTTLIDSPRINILRNNYSDKIDVDVSDMVWALFGTAVHRVLESTDESDNVIVEERYTPTSAAGLCLVSWIIKSFYLMAPCK